MKWFSVGAVIILIALLYAVLHMPSNSQGQWTCNEWKYWNDSDHTQTRSQLQRWADEVNDNESHQIYAEVHLSQYNATLELTNLSTKPEEDSYTCRPGSPTGNCSLEQHSEIKYTLAECTEYIKTRESLPRSQR